MTHETQHRRSDCSAHHLTFGGHCFNCGINPTKYEPRDEVQVLERLRAHGFDIPDKAPRHA